MARLFDVELHGKVIGSLRESADGHVEFQFNQPYRASRPREVLGQAFIDDVFRPYIGKQRELPPFFANLVPEGELRPFLERHLQIEAGDDLGLLEVVGRDLPGAVEIHRAPAASDDGEDVGWSAGARIPPRELVPDDEELRFSLAGVQLKFSVVQAADKVTLPVSGARGDKILKLDSARFPGVVENEYTMLRWAHHAGFIVPECEVVATTTLAGRLIKHAAEGINALLITRYDRGPERIHQEDFAQMLNVRPSNKYANFTYERLARLVQDIVGAAARDEFIRRLVFMVASGNADAHLKNWSLIYPDHIHPELSPLYDQVCTAAWPELDASLALKLVGVKRFEHIQRSTFERTADALGLEHWYMMNLVDDTLDRLIVAWEHMRTGTQWRMSDDHTTALREHWASVPLLAQRELVET